MIMGVRTPEGEWKMGHIRLGPATPDSEMETDLDPKPDKIKKLARSAINTLSD